MITVQVNNAVLRKAIEADTQNSEARIEFYKKRVEELKAQEPDRDLREEDRRQTRSAYSPYVPSPHSLWESQYDDARNGVHRHEQRIEKNQKLLRALDLHESSIGRLSPSVIEVHYSVLDDYKMLEPAS